MTYSPFDISRAIGNNLSQGFRESRDETLIEKVLAQTANDPEAMQGAISTILSKVSPERQGPAIQYLQNAYESIVKKRQLAEEEVSGRKAAEEAGYTYGVPPTVAAAQVEANAKAKRLAPFGLGLAVDQPEAVQAGGLAMGGDVGDMASTVSPIAGALPGVAAAPAQAPAVKPITTWLQQQSKDKLKLLAGHPDKEVSEPAKLELDARQKDEEIKRKQDAEDRKYQHEYHKESAKYDEKLEENARTAKKQMMAIEDIDSAVASGNVSPFNLSSIFKGFGVIGDKISAALLSGDEAKLQASIPQLLEGWKEVFGVRLSDADLKILEDKLPSMGKDKIANTAITKILKKYAEISTLRGQIAADIKKENNGLRPLGYASMVEERLDKMTMPVKIVNPKNGRVIEIPAFKVGDAVKAGATIYNEQL